MNKNIVTFVLSICFMLSACAQTTGKNEKAGSKTTEKTPTVMDNNHEEKDSSAVKTEAEWKKILSPEAYHVLREKGTERPYIGKLLENKEKGMYVCGACGNELFSSDMKFDSHCGWPSFDKEIAGGKIKTHIDTSFGMVRTEIMCAKCGSHLGHLFDDGPTETGMRYCVNSLSLDFKEEKGK
jgi:methionine-R-sulfoxide reductase